MAREFTSDTHNLRTSTFVQPGSVGTVSLWVYPNWAHNDNAVRPLFFYGEYLPTYNEFSFQKFNDNNIYIGWSQGGNDDRISIAATSGMFSSGVWNNHVFTWDDTANTCEYFSGGVSQSSRTADLQTFTIVGQETIGNGLEDLGQVNSNCRIAEFGMWNVVLTSSEVASLSKGFSPLLIRPDALVEYHQLFGDGTTETCLMGASILTVTGTAKAAHPPIIYPSNVYSYVPIAGGGSSTLNADAGSYTLTGQAAKFDLTQSSSSGAYSLTGSTSSFDLEINLDAGSYAITGAAADLIATGVGSVTLNADAGSYSITGQPATFDIEENLAAGSYSLTGQASTFDLNMLAGAGSYTITGAAADLIAQVSVTIDAEPGAYSITGFDANLIATGQSRGDGSGWERFKDLKPLKKRLKSKNLPEPIIDVIEEIVADQNIVSPVKKPITTLRKELKQKDIVYEPIYGEILKIELMVAIEAQKQMFYEQEEEELLILMAA